MGKPACYAAVVLCVAMAVNRRGRGNCQTLSLHFGYRVTNYKVLSVPFSASYGFAALVSNNENLNTSSKWAAPGDKKRAGLPE